MTVTTRCNSGQQCEGTDGKRTRDERRESHKSYNDGTTTRYDGSCPVSRASVTWPVSPSSLFTDAADGGGGGGECLSAWSTGRR